MVQWFQPQNTIKSTMEVHCNIVFPEKNNKIKKLELDLTSTLEDLNEFLLPIFSVDSNEQAFLFYYTPEAKGKWLPPAFTLEEINIASNPTLYAFLRPVNKNNARENPIESMIQSNVIEEKTIVYILNAINQSKTKLRLERDTTIQELKEFYSSYINLPKYNKLEFHLEGNQVTIPDSKTINDLTSETYSGDLTLVAKMIFIGGSYGRLC